MATMVWYIGDANSRTVSSSEWLGYGIIADSITWSAANGWAVPDNIFNSDQLNVLDNDSGFLLGQTGPRLHRAPATAGDVRDSAYVYARRIQDQFDNLGNAISEESQSFFEGLDVHSVDAGGGNAKLSINGVLSSSSFAGNPQVWSAVVGRPVIRPRGNKLTAIGNSMSADDVNPRFMGKTYISYLAALSKGRIERLPTHAVGGQTFAYMRANLLPEVLALTGDNKPDACVIEGATNDWLTRSFADMKADVIFMAETLEANEICPILWKVPPGQAGTFSVSDPMVRWSAWIDEYSQQRGYPVIDAYSSLISKDGHGVWRASNLQTGDGVHPSLIGHKEIAAYAIAHGLADIFPPTSPGKTYKTIHTSHNIWNDGVHGAFGLNCYSADFGTEFSVSGIGSNKIAGPWTTNAFSDAIEVVAGSDDDDIVGYWQKVMSSNPVNESYLDGGNIITGFSVGDTIRLATRVKSHVEAFGGKWRFNITTAARNFGWFDNKADIDGLLEFDMVVASGDNFLNVSAGVGFVSTGVADILVAETTWKNLTVMGLA